MNKVTVVVGLALILIGLAGYLGSAASKSPDASASAGDTGTEIDADSGGDGTASHSTKRSATALIPAVFGLLLLLLGLWAFKESSRKLAMHIAVLVGVLGAIAAGGRGIPGLIKMLSGDVNVNSRATLFVLLMFVVCLVYVILCVRSFVAARRSVSNG